MKTRLIQPLFYILFSSFLAIQLPAQDRWAQVIGDEGAEFAYDLLKTSDGGFLVSAYDSDGGTSDFSLIKLFANGTVEWQNTVSLSNYSERGFSAIEAQNGDFILFGNGGHGNWPYAVRFSPQGDTLWTTQWSEEIEYNRALLAFGTELPDGRLAMITYSNLNRPYLYLIQSNGELIEERELTSLVPPYWYSGTFTHDIAQTDDGGFVICGATSGGIGSAFIWRFDANADSVWSNVYQADQSPLRYAQSIKQSSDGGFIVAGAIGPNATASGALRTDADGNLLWAKAYQPDSLYTQGFDIAETESGKLLLVENSFSGFGTTIFKSNLLELDPDGNLLARKPIIGSDTSTKVLKIIPDQGEGFVVAGWLKNVRNVAESDIYIMKTDISGTQPECVFDCVWPGDSNNDGLVDMADLMLLGLTSGFTGPQRGNPTIGWYAQNALPWNDTLPNNENMKYADCNGDGISNDDDTLAIIQNYTFTHPINPFKAGAAEGTPVFLGVDEVELSDNNRVSIPVYFGDELSQVKDFYGMMFRIAYQNEWIKESTLQLDFTDAWIYSGNGKGLDLQMKHAGLPLVDIGITKTDHLNISGFGHLATLSFELLNNFEDLPAEGISITFNVHDLSAHSRAVEEIPVMGGEFTIEVNASTTAVDALTPGAEIMLWPNPVKSNILNLRSDAEIEFVQVLDITGKRLIEMNINDRQAILNVQQLMAGTYIANIIHTNGVRKHKVFVVD
jgi:hypothetical protein